MTTTTKSILSWIGATFLAALAPILVLTAFFDFMVTTPPTVEAYVRKLAFYLGFVFPFTLGVAVFIGLPAAGLLRAKGWVHWRVAVLGGFVIGVVSVSLLMLSLGLAARPWRELAMFGGVGGGFGILGALVFWGTLKLLGELEPRSSNTALASGQSS